MNDAAYLVLILIVIPIVARPGEPGWTDIFQFVLIFPALFGASDLSASRKQSRQ